MASNTIRTLLLCGTVGLGSASIGFFAGRHSAAPSLSLRDTSLRPLADQRAPLQKLTAIDDSPFGKPVLVSAHAESTDLRAQLQTPNGEEKAREDFKELGGVDPVRALQLAERAATPRQRELLRNAVLQGWAAVDPQAACDWALQHIRPEERRVAVEGIAAGAIAKPTEAVTAINAFILADPTMASDYGNALVSELSRAGQFALAGKFASEGTSEYRAAWLSTAFSRWAEYQPGAALQAVNSLADDAVRRDALQGVITGWAASDPASLVTYAQTSFSGESRSAALRDGLLQWVSLDPVAASNWMDQLDPSVDLDTGAAALATVPALVEKKPEIAASWAESIADPELRSNTLLDMIRLWGTTNREAARRYAATSPVLRPETRELALSSLQPSP